jgi:hypothetical protein
MTLVPVAAALLLCLLPSVLFLALWYVLGRMRRGSLLGRIDARDGAAVRVVTWRDVLDAAADPRTSLPTSSSEWRSPTRDDRCSVCGATTDPVASFCHDCSARLE